MKNKKGFTLVELLGVIVILSMIVLVTVPALITTINNSEAKRVEEFDKTIQLAAESYFQINSDSFPQLNSTGGKAFVPVSTLIEEGYLKETTIDPHTNEKINKGASIQALLNPDGTVTYTFVELNLSYQGYEQTGLILMYDGLQRMFGNKVEDLSPRGYHGVMLGLDDASGWQGNRIKFDGVDDRINQVVPITGDFTVEVVVGNDIGALNAEHYGSIFIANEWNSTTETHPSLQLFYDGRTTPKLSFRALVPKTATQEYAENYISNTNITALRSRNTFTFIKTGSSLKAYFNNTLVGSLTNTAFINRFNVRSLNLSIGTWGQYYTYFDLYSFRIYNIALTEEQRISNYQLDISRF